jgi:hypothetical protein
MMRGNMSTSHGGQEATATENKGARARGHGAKRGGGEVGQEALVQHQQMMGGGSGQGKKCTIK